MAETFAPSSSTPAATQVNVTLEELRSKAENPTTSVDDLRKALKDGLGWLLALPTDKDNEVWSHITQKDQSEVSKPWKERVSNIEKEVASLNEQYDEARHIQQDIYRRQHIVKEIKMALDNVIKLLEECPPERVIKEIDVPSISGFPTLQNALEEVQQVLLQNDGPKCVKLEGDDDCVGKTIIMQHLNNFFYDNPDDNKFDVVIFIKVAAREWHDIPQRIDDRVEDLEHNVDILQKIAERMKVDIGGNGFEVAERVRKVLENKRYLLMLDGLTQSTSIRWIWDSLKISNDIRRGSKVVITNLSWGLSVDDWGNIDIELKPFSPTEAWKVFRERTSSSTSTYSIGGPVVTSHFQKQYIFFHQSRASERLSN